MGRSSVKAGAVQMGQMMYTDSKSWNDDYMGPAMMAPPLFCMLILCTGLALLAIYCCMDWWHRKRLTYSIIPQTVKDRDVRQQQQHSRQFEVFSIDDSANETSDGTIFMATALLFHPIKIPGSHHLRLSFFVQLRRGVSCCDLCKGLIQKAKHTAK